VVVGELRLLIPLAEVPGLDPVGLRLYGHRGGLLGLALAANPLMYYPYDHQRPIIGDPTVCHASTADSAARDRLLHWLADSVGIYTRNHIRTGVLERGCSAPAWWPSQVGGWYLGAFGSPVHFGPTPRTMMVGYRRVDTVYVVPALDGLDRPIETRVVPGTAGLYYDFWAGERLPDGSCESAALALAAVVRHVGLVQP
jgi:hypothetical protein